MKAIITALLTFILVGFCVTTSAAELPLPNGQLVSKINYWISDDFGMVDDEGRSLVWEGEIAGDLNGYMKWWIDFSKDVPVAELDAGILSFYSGRWEVWSDEGDLLLAGESAGKTFNIVLGDGVWDGVGVVTEAKGKYSPLKGRKTYETGSVVSDGGPPSGNGMFTVQ